MFVAGLVTTSSLSMPTSPEFIDCNTPAHTLLVAENVVEERLVLPARESR